MNSPHISLFKQPSFNNTAIFTETLADQPYFTESKPPNPNAVEFRGLASVNEGTQLLYSLLTQDTDPETRMLGDNIVSKRFRQQKQSEPSLFGAIGYSHDTETPAVCLNAIMTELKMRIDGEKAVAFDGSFAGDIQIATPLAEQLKVIAQTNKAQKRDVHSFMGWESSLWMDQVLMPFTGATLTINEYWKWRPDGKPVRTKNPTIAIATEIDLHLDSEIPEEVFEIKKQHSVSLGSRVGRRNLPPMSLHFLVSAGTLVALDRISDNYGRKKYQCELVAEDFEILLQAPAHICN